ncbi:MAG: response regulator [Bacteroidales bacterium]
MTTENERVRVFLVDDDALYLNILELEFLENAGFIIETFSTGELCVAHLENKPDLIVLDYILDNVDKNAMNGIQTLDKIKAYNPQIPVIILSAQDKIEVAVDCMHHQATDYVVKSETAFFRLNKIIRNVLQYQKVQNELNWYMKRM